MTIVLVTTNGALPRDLGLVSMTVAALLGLAFAACGGGGGPPLTDRLVVERDAGIAIVDLSTGEEDLLLPNPEEAFLVDPVISPDRSRIAYVQRLAPFVEPGEEPDLGADLFVAAADGSNPQLLAEHRQRAEELRTPSWLPDGSGLIFSRLRVEQRAGENVFVKTLERIDLATGELTVIVESGFQPTVCSDGQRVVYLNDDNLVMTMWMANIDGSGAQQIAGPDGGFSWFNSPKFSPTCDRVAFGGAPLPEEQTSAEHAPRYVATRGSTAFASSAAAAAAYNGLPEDIWVLDLAAGSFRNIADLDLDLPNLTWSGDGERIFLLAGAGIFVIDSAGGERKVAEGTFHGHIDWLAAE